MLLIGNSLFLAIGCCLLPLSLHFWPSCYPFLVYAKQGIFVRYCKVRHSVTKPYRITVGNIIYVQCISLCF